VRWLPTLLDNLVMQALDLVVEVQVVLDLVVVEDLICLDLVVEVVCLQVQWEECPSKECHQGLWEECPSKECHQGLWEECLLE